MYMQTHIIRTPMESNHRDGPVWYNNPLITLATKRRWKGIVIIFKTVLIPNDVPIMII